MKALLVILAIYINYVLCESNKFAVKSYPKKVKPYGTGKILINSGKYVYKIKPKTTTQSNKKYTVFQVVGISKTIQGVPDSPYFPVDQSYDHKPRVKKVLPDYAWSSLRSKRSAVLESPPTQNDENKAEVNTSKSKPVEKIGQTSPFPKVIPTLTTQAEPSLKVATVVQRKSADPSDEKKSDPDDSKVNTQKEEPVKAIERAGKAKPVAKENKNSAATKKGGLTGEKSNKKSERNSDKKSDLKSNTKESRSSTLKPKAKDNVTEPKLPSIRAKLKRKESKIDAKVSPAKVKSKGTEAKEKLNVESTYVRLRDKGKNASATHARVNLKGDATNLKVTNVRNKKNNTNSKANRTAKRSKNKKLKRKRATNNQTAVRAAKGKKLPKRKINARTKKGRKTKSTNGTRTGKMPKGKLIKSKRKLNKIKQ